MSDTLRPLEDTREWPQLLKPVPRRPFRADLSHVEPEVDGNGEQERVQVHEWRVHTDKPTITASDLSFLDSRRLRPSSREFSHESRSRSYTNINASTLFGIYSYADEEDFEVGNHIASSWGTETTALRPQILEPKPRKRAPPPVRRQRSCFLSPEDSAASFVVSKASRALLLFALGVGFGVLVMRLSTSAHNLDTPGLSHLQPNCLFIWGLGGVALGSLLPWFDSLWERKFGRHGRRHLCHVPRVSTSKDAAETDWALVVRSIGAFVGIVFAIRRVPWASTLQVSTTLALANPFLWYLIDRSVPGLLLSTAVGTLGSATIVNLDLHMMPAPAGFNGTTNAHSGQVLVDKTTGWETLETSVWMLSVLFCSCLCFGNVGRRLTLSSGRSVM